MSARAALDAAESLRRGEGLLGLSANTVILALLAEVERLQAFVPVRVVAGIPCAVCGAGPTEHCDRRVHRFCADAA